LLFTAAVLLTGCSTAQTFQLLLTVLNKADGKPVPEVKVTLDTLGVEERKLDENYGWPHDAKTDVSGKFAYDYLVSPYPSEAPHWYLKVSKEGFEPVVIDIKPSPQPEKTDARIPLNLTVEIQPEAEPPR
jgi:hypothetical protein